MREKLTPKQEAFINAYLETGNASEAYRRAYDAAGMLPATVNRKAAELLDNGKITARLAVFSDKAEVKALLSLEEHMEELKALRDMAKGANQFSAAIAAEVKRGELRKFYIKQIESGGAGDFDRMTTEELRAYVYGDDDKRPPEDQVKH